MARTWRRTLGMGLLAAIAATAPAASSTDEGAQRADLRAVNVMLIYTEPRLAPSVIALDEAFRATLESALGRPVFFYTEYLDLQATDAAQPGLQQLLRRKYSGRRLDL